MSAIQIPLSDVPYLEGRFNLKEPEFTRLLIEALETYLITSKHPRDKKVVLKPLILANYVAYGTLNAFYRMHEKQGFKTITRRVKKRLLQIKIDQHGSYFVLPHDTLQQLAGDLLGGRI